MSSKQKVKGSGFEREVAKALTAMYGENFMRVPNSGAYVGGKNAHRRGTLTEGQSRHAKGDVVGPESFFKMNMECKFYSDILFHQLFQQNCSLLDTWISQSYDAADDGDINVIIMKINRKGKYVCIEDHDHLSKDRGLKYKDWYIFDYDTFFEDNFENFRDICGGLD